MLPAQHQSHPVVQTVPSQEILLNCGTSPVLSLHCPARASQYRITSRSKRPPSPVLESPLMSPHSTSPSVYLVLSSVRATNLCGAVGSESTQMITLSFPQNYLYTYAGEVGNLGAPGQQASSALFNPSDLANCTSTTVFNDYGPHFANPCSPFIVAPTQLLDIDPAFSTCTVGRPLLLRHGACDVSNC